MNFYKFKSEIQMMRNLENYNAKVKGKTGKFLRKWYNANYR